jgi:hypothetical protein
MHDTSAASAARFFKAQAARLAAEAARPVRSDEEMSWFRALVLGKLHETIPKRQIQVIRLVEAESGPTKRHQVADAIAWLIARDHATKLGDGYVRRPRRDEAAATAAS